ncbi:MAG: ATP-binding cassette domain-containing protein, partial [Desulfobacteraceae bacterium]|nr:ATP-binding cassette domain-containing protein [Desulfobacteraceae bacterium]
RCLYGRKGIGFVPEDRWIFPGLTVLQNLQLGQKSAKRQGRWRIEDVFNLFPRLGERSNVHGGLISGGEKQMLTICRTLMGDPDFIMIDEPTEGLAPMMVEHIGRLIEEIANRGISVLLVEQKLSIALKISQRLYIMGQGRIVFEGTPDDIKNNQAIRKEWLEV